MFETLKMAPADSILGLTVAFNKDSNPNKINLGVGVYKDASGATPILNSVKEAERRLVADAKTKSYMPITGSPVYGKLTQQLLFGANNSVITSGRAYTANTPGGTGALRVAAEFVHRCNSSARVWLSNPTWANHNAIFEAAGLETLVYSYYDAATREVDFEGMLASLDAARPGDALLLHACCHNPSGVDLNDAQWQQVVQLVKDKSLLPIVDFAYQGFGSGLDEDAAGLRLLCDVIPEILVCSSYSKNFGLYQDRVGAFTLVAADSDTGARAFSQAEKVIRANYSNPPAHGSLVVSTILEDAGLKAMWEKEVEDMRDRISDMRALFVDTLQSLGVEQDFSFIRRQHGMFSFSGLTKAQVDALRDRHAIYIVGSGRISVAGMTQANMPALCNAIADVL